jgi:hypothetical protein
VGKYAAGNARLADRRRLEVEGDGEHSAPNIPADGLRVQKVVRGDSDANADILSKMNVWHYSDTLNIRRPPQALDGFGYVILQGCYKPALHRSDRVLTHMRHLQAAPSQMSARALACG